MSAPRLNFFSWGRLQDEPDEEVAPKRISTPAGLRLSSIINTESAKNSTESPSFSARFSNPSFSPRLSLTSKRFSGIRVVDPDPAEAPVEEQKSKFTEELNSLHGLSVPASALASPGYAGSLSEKSERLLPGQHEAQETTRKRRACRRRIIFGLIALFLILLAVVIGLAVGLRKRHNSSTSSTTGSQSSPTSSSPESTSSSTTKPSSPVSSGFSAGSYSFQTFLDMPITDCVTNSAVWTCPPNTSGPDNSKSLATFPFTITGSSGAYKLESTANTNAFANITTRSTPLTLVDAGKSSENYRFRVFLEKRVSATINGVSAICTYQGTTIQGNLYTKMSSSYPLAGQQVSNSAGPQWPYAFKLEQTASSADSAPQCVNAVSGTVLSGTLASSSAESLCSCIYRNFKT